MFDDLAGGYFKYRLGEIAPYGQNVVNLGNNIESMLENTTTNTTTNSGFNFNNFLGSKALQGGLALGSFAKDLFNSWNAYSSGKKALKEQKRGNDILQNQLNIENQRYNEREAERKKANAQIAASASVWNRQ